MDEEYGLYEGEAKKFLKNNNLVVWDYVEIRLLSGKEIEGAILPGFEGVTNEIYLKLPNGYNIAFKLDKISKIVKKGHITAEYRVKEINFEQKKNLPKVKLFGAGGTIASRVEYSTGAVKPSFNPTDLLNAVPELYDIARIDTEMILNIFSEDMKSEYWIEIAKKVYEALREDEYRGVIITHGTDTMHYTASALAFMLENLPAPVVLTGAQRSSDRPASDSAVNLIASAVVASKSDIGESMIVMHANLSDDVCFAHRGVRARKMHSSRRDAFKTIGDTPLASIKVNKDRTELKILKQKGEYMKIVNNREELIIYPYFEKKTALVYIHPNISGDLIETLIDKGYRGIVLMGTGLGHVPNYILKSIKRGADEGVIFFMTTQCLWGPVNMNVYERGRRLQKIGVYPADGMLPETAYVKLGWLLGMSDDKKFIIEKMTENMRGEIIKREKLKSYIC